MALAVAAACAAAGIMNAGGVPYKLSNPEGSTKDWRGTPGVYSTDFEQNVKGAVEHFDVYGEIRTQYSQVYWTRNTPIELPPALVERFAGKSMAITGYEVDQVTHSGPQNGTTTKGDVLGGFACYPDCSEGDKSVPSYHAYNHHYFSWLIGGDAEMYEAEKPTGAPNPTKTTFRTKAGTEHAWPTNIVFQENPGGEYRKSYHGYPSGYAQLIHSPSQWIVEPMQIDTHNRRFGINDNEGYVPDFLPKQQQNRSQTQLTGGLSPLIECPCSDRITKHVYQTPVLQSSGTCAQPVASEAACASAVAGIAAVASSATVQNASLPAGCVAVPAGGGQYAALFNTAPSGVDCGAATVAHVAGESAFGIGVSVAANVSAAAGGAVTLTLTGPSDAWFAVGFDAEGMYSAPYAVVVDAAGAVTERRLGNHAPGTLLPASVTVVSSAVAAGRRTVVLTRPAAGATAQHYTFPAAAGLVKLIAAHGFAGTPFQYHQQRTAGQVLLLSTAPVCVCAPAAPRGFVQYMGGNEDAYRVSCEAAPRSDMAAHGDGTGRGVANAACGDGAHYHGGLHCCKHTWFLTDQEQQAETARPGVDVYFLKWRYYFQEYVPAARDAAGAVAAPASHKHLHHWVFLIDADVNDYEEDNAAYGTPSVGRITANLTGADMGHQELPAAGFEVFTPLVMTPHFHAPNSLREELWNADTNELLCNATAEYGSPEYGSTNATFNEKDYVAIPPCLFGAQAGLQYPWNITASTKIRAVKVMNNTFRHLGQMAQWTGLGVYDTDPY